MIQSFCTLAAFGIGCFLVGLMLGTFAKEA